MSERIIVASNSKDEIKKFIDNINHEINGKRITLNEKEFKSFLKSRIVTEYYKCTGELIDDFETTIIDNDNSLLILKKVIEDSSFGFFPNNLKKQLIELVDYAIEKKSGIIFFF